MPEFNCFITVEEYAQVLATAIASGFRLCLNKWLLAPRHEYVTDTRAIPDLLQEKQDSFFLERGDFSRHPIDLRAITRDGRRMWHPSVTKGGPVIETYFFHPYTKGHARILPCSLIAYGRNFFDPTTGREELAGEPAKRAYDTIVVPLRKSFRRVESEQRKRVAYVSPGVEARLDGGWTLADPFTGSRHRP